MQSVVLSLAHCYYYRLGDSRVQLSDAMDRIITMNMPVQLGYYNRKKFVEIIRQEHSRYVDLMEIPKGIAKNKALKENLFMILVCVMIRIPIVLVGKPGSSKTLSMIIIRDNLSASTKNKKLSALAFQDM